MSNIAILGDSHSVIYNYCNLNNYFKQINIHYTDQDNYCRTGKFMPYLVLLTNLIILKIIKLFRKFNM